MAALALKWAYTRPISNPVAKNILAFLASHNFGGDQTCFRVKTIMAATAYKERSVREALNFLYKEGYLKKQARYGDKGQQLTNEYTLNINEEYKQKWYDDYHESAELSTAPLQEMQPPPAPHAGPPLHSVHPLNANAFNNNNNKSFKILYDQKKDKSKTHSNRSTVSEEFKASRKGSTQKASDCLSDIRRKLGNKMKIKADASNSISDKRLE